MGIFEWIFANKATIVEAWLALIGFASIIVKMTPTLKDDHILKGLIRFVGKWIAINRK